MTITERLKEISERAEKATPGPWKTAKCHTPDCWCLCIGNDPSDEKSDNVSGYGNLSANDAAYIAHSSPDRVTRLLDALEKLKAGLEKVEACFDCEFCEMSNQMVCEHHLDDRMKIARATLRDVFGEEK